MLLAAAGAVYLWSDSFFHGERPDLLLHTIRYEKLQLSIVEKGTLESAHNSDVVCRVQARQGSTYATTIKWVIDNGAYVRQGEQIVDLDDAGLQDQLKAQKIVLDQARAAAIQAEENYKIIVSQNYSDIHTAQVAVQLAELDLIKYQQGEYPQFLKEIQGRIETAESDLEMWRDRAAWSERMVKKGYLSPSQALADRYRLRGAEISLGGVIEELRVLEFTRQRTETELASNLAEAKRALDRIQKQATATEIQAAIERQSKQSIYEQEAARYREIEEEIRKCDIFAPQDGMVVYYMPEQSRYGSGSQQSIIAQGEPVREGQKLMQIPDMRHMQVDTRVHEALVSRVQGEVYESTGFCDNVRAALLTIPHPLARLSSQWAFLEMRDGFRDYEQRQVFAGQPALIRVHAFPERLIRGHVKQVATIASQADWYSSDVKVYKTVVALDEQVPGLRPGMTADVTIVIDDVLDHVLTIPVQAIIGSAELGPHRQCFVMTPTGPEKRDIIIGLSNDRMAEVRSGLWEGEQVILNPRAILGDQAKTRQPGGKSQPGVGKARDPGKTPDSDQQPSEGGESRRH